MRKLVAGERSSLGVCALITLVVALTACGSTDKPPAVRTVYVTVTEATPAAEATEKPVTVSEPTEQSKTFGDGVWIMPDEMPFGTYRAPGGNSCYYEVLRNFSGDLSAIITNDVMVKNPIVTISSNAAGFNTTRCGEWTRIKR